MVQLKLIGVRLYDAPGTGFNSCMVQLKYMSKSSSMIFTRCFNSCMVQLKS